jgi:hypothetical protein
MIITSNLANARKIDMTKKPCKVVINELKEEKSNRVSPADYLKFEVNHYNRFLVIFPFFYVENQEMVAPAASTLAPKKQSVLLFP